MPAPGHFEMLALAAKDSGIRVFDLPYMEDDFDAILSLMPNFEQAQGIYNGGVVDQSWYRGLQDVAKEHGISMFNSAAENARVMLFEEFYPHIKDITAESIVIKSEQDIQQSIKELGFPVFIKGQIASNKHLGLSSCLANNETELRKEFVKQKTLVARRILPLRKNGATHNDFPVSREYRYYLHNLDILGSGFYWNDVDPFGPLSYADNKQITDLLEKVVTRIKTPLISIDVAQLESGEWCVIEVGDPQHTGIGQMPKQVYLQKIKELCHR